VHLSSVTGATGGDVDAIGLIVNDDGVAPLSAAIGDVAAPEGYLSGSTLAFPVRLSRAATAPASVFYYTSSGSAFSSSDYTYTSGVLTFAPGDTERVISVPVKGDAVVEPNETFQVYLYAASGLTLSDDIGVGTILNDDGSTIAVTNSAVKEGTAGPATSLAFTVVLSATSTQTITVNYATADGTAVAGSDYTSTSGILNFPPGAASRVVLVPVSVDAAIEPDETLFLNLSSATNASISDGQGLGTIMADDGLLVSIADKTTAEGNSGHTPVGLVLSLSQVSPAPVTVDWSTEDGTARAPLDYEAAGGTVTFDPGEVTKAVTLQVVGDAAKESFETFFVNLANPTGGAVIADGQGQVTIANTDGATDRSRLMFHNFSTNRLYRWHMKNGNTLDTYNWVTPWATDPGWTVGAVADFDQDGQLDYLWHNVNDGRLLFWYIDGDNLKGYQFLPYTMGPPWRVATTFDANNDGAADIAYYSSVSGVIRVVLHDNATRLSEYDLGLVLPGAGSVRVVSAVDANNDGDDELALYNSSSGQVAAWNVTGPTVTGTISYANLQSTSQAFNLVSTRTDFNSDGLPDFLWHNPTPTGVFSVWFMNGTTRLGVGTFQPFTATDPVWRVVGSANVW
ncbi:MAG: hypothetical protein K1Y01_06860, partial [Vicinamibacteria bacterium]|nr:hypothetical protein [Vicinamibacteria bacterium]